MSYQPPSAGYGRPDLRAGMVVSSDNGWTGQIVEVIPPSPGYEGGVRVAWTGDGITVVALPMFVVENGQVVIRTQPPPPVAHSTVPLAPLPDEQDMELTQLPSYHAPEEEMQTQMASPVPVRDEPARANPYLDERPMVAPEPPPIHPYEAMAESEATQLPPAPPVQDPSHVNPYVTDPPMVAPEPPPIHPTHGGQERDLDATYLPPSAREPLAGAVPDAGATYIPTERRQPAMPEAAPPAPLSPTPVTYGAMEAEMPAAAHAPEVIDAAQREVTVPIIEEHVEARAEWRDAGAIHVRTIMEEVPQTFTQQTEREELFVERVAVGRVLDEGEEVLPREEDDHYIVPVVIEEAVVVTRRVLTEELRITKRIIPTTQTVQAITRRERVEIDAGTLADRIHEGSGTDAATDVPRAMRTENPS